MLLFSSSFFFFSSSLLSFLIFSSFCLFFPSLDNATDQPTSFSDNTPRQTDTSFGLYFLVFCGGVKARDLPVISTKDPCDCPMPIMAGKQAGKRGKGGRVRSGLAPTQQERPWEREREARQTGKYLIITQSRRKETTRLCVVSFIFGFFYDKTACNSHIRTCSPSPSLILFLTFSHPTRLHCIQPSNTLAYMTARNSHWSVEGEEEKRAGDRIVPAGHLTI